MPWKECQVKVPADLSAATAFSRTALASYLVAPAPDQSSSEMLSATPRFYPLSTRNDGNAITFQTQC